MAEYKANSHRVKEEKATTERKKLDRVATGKVKTKKKSDIHKLTDVFISEDVASVKEYILMDVLLPTVKKAISDMVTNGVDMLLYGEARGSKKERGSKVSYSKYYDSRDRDYDRRGTSDRTRTRARSTYDYDEIVLESRGEAEEVIERMDDLLDTYGIVSVADLYDLVGITGNYTDNKYGWTSLRNASVQRLRDGYLLKLPKALPID